MERLTKRIETGQVYTPYCDYQMCDGECLTCDYEDKILEKLAEYEDLEEQGMLLRLPCKYNDNLYWVFDGYVREVWFKGIRCDKGYKPQIIARFIDGRTLKSKEEPITILENIGKTVFLTKEEAEQALAKMKEV